MQTKLKNPTLRNTLRFLILFLFIFPISCQESDEESIIEDDLSQLNLSDIEGIDLSIVDDLMTRVDASETGLSRQQVSKIFTSHGIDFESEYQKLLSDSTFSSIHYDGGPQMIQKGSNSAPTVRPFIYAFGEYNSVTLKFSWPVKKHLARIVNIINIEESHNWSTKAKFKEYMLYKVAKIGDDIAYDPDMSIGIKHNLLKALSTYYDTSDKAYEYLTEHEPDYAPNVRVRWKRFWKRVRSVVATTAVHTFVGLVTGGPAAAIAAGSMAFVGSILDIVFNDKCHFATRCENGHVENCSTGECIDQDNRIQTGGPHFNPSKISNSNQYFSGFIPKVGQHGCKSECCGFGSRVGSIIEKNAKIGTCEADEYLRNVSSLDIYPWTGTTTQPFPFSLEGAVDMAEAPVSSKYSATQYTQLGFPRSAGYFWKTYTDPHNALSSANRIRASNVAKEGVPKVDDQWRNNMPGQKYAKDKDPIEHHHVLQGRWAIPIAKNLHRIGDNYSSLHPKFKDSDAFISNEEALIRAAKTIYGRFAPNAKEIFEGSFEEDPLALLNNIFAFGSSDLHLGLPVKGYFEEGKMYYLVDRDAYLRIHKVYYKTTQRKIEDIWKLDYTVYAGYGYDRWAREYFGIGVLSKGYIKVGNYSREENDKKMMPKTLEELLKMPV